MSCTMTKGRSGSVFAKKLAFLRHSSKKIFIAICIFTFILLFVLSWKRLNAGEVPRFTQQSNKDARDWTQIMGEKKHSEEDSLSSREKGFPKLRDFANSQVKDTLSVRLKGLLGSQEKKEPLNLQNNVGRDTNDGGNVDDRDDDTDVSDTKVEKQPPSVIQIENASTGEADQNLDPGTVDKSAQLQYIRSEKQDEQLSPRELAKKRWKLAQQKQKKEELKSSPELENAVRPDKLDSHKDDGFLFAPRNRSDTRESLGEETSFQRTEKEDGYQKVRNEVQNTENEVLGGLGSLPSDAGPVGPASDGRLPSPGDKPRNPEVLRDIQAKEPDTDSHASNETVVHEVAMHNELLKALQAKVEKLKHIQFTKFGEENKRLLQLLTRGEPFNSPAKTFNKLETSKSQEKETEFKGKSEPKMNSGVGDNRETADKNGGDAFVKNEKSVNSDSTRFAKPSLAAIESAKAIDSTMKATNSEKAEVMKPDENIVVERPDSCYSCFKSNFPVLIDQKGYCHRMSQPPIVMLLIASAPNNVDQRQAIRETWGAKCQDPSSTFRCLFVLGEDGTARANEDLILENEKYKDILQFGFKDAYFNLTYKTMASLQWADMNCPHISYVMKTDDDMFLNTELISVMLTAAPTNGLWGGFCWGISNPNRNSQTKWYVSFEMYKKPKFPAMCSGTGYILSRDLVTHIIDASRDVPFFHLEDVYVALCLRNSIAQPRRINGFNNMFTPFDECSYRNHVMSSHQISPNDLRYYWKQMMKCPKQEFTGRQLFVQVGYPPTR